MRGRVIVGCPLWNSDVPWNKSSYDNKEVELATRITVRLPDYVKDPISGETVKKVVPVQTGDVFKYGGFIILLGAGVILIVVAAVKSRKGGKE